MNSSATTIKAFGIYVVLTGVGLIAMPDTILSMFGFPPTTDPWIRVLGALACVVGYYYWACGAANATAFARATIPGRLAFCALCVGLVASGSSPLPLLMFGVVDVLGAAWTAWALHREARLAAA